MTIHFEEVWEHAERTFKLKPLLLEELLNQIGLDLNELKSLEGRLAHEKFGEVLFNICGLTMIKNINAYSALQEETENKTQQILNPDE